MAPGDCGLFVSSSAEQDQLFDASQPTGATLRSSNLQIVARHHAQLIGKYRRVAAQPTIDR